MGGVKCLVGRQHPPQTCAWLRPWRTCSAEDIRYDAGYRRRLPNWVAPTAGSYVALWRCCKPAGPLGALTGRATPAGQPSQARGTCPYTAFSAHNKTARSPTNASSDHAVHFPPRSKRHSTARTALLGRPGPSGRPKRCPLPDLTRRYARADALA
jgi:hypothetical protein